MTIDQVLDIIAEEVRRADEKAAEACRKSKYSIQDYWMCVEFAQQRLHDRIAKEAGSPRRCPVFPFRARLAQFKKVIVADAVEGL